MAKKVVESKKTTPKKRGRKPEFVKVPIEEYSKMVIDDWENPCIEVLFKLKVNYHSPGIPERWNGMSAHTKGSDEKIRRFICDNMKKFENVREHILSAVELYYSEISPDEDVRYLEGLS